MDRFNSLSTKGFSLVSVLVGVGIVSIMALGIAMTVGNGIDGMSHMRNSALAEDITGLVSGMMGDPDYCLLQFKGANIGSTLPSVIVSNVSLKDVAPSGTLGTNVIVGTGKKYQNVLQVDSISLNVENMIGPNRYLGSVKLSLKGNTGYNLYFNRSIPLHIATDMTGKITACGRAAEVAHGTTQGVWSETCADFAAKGWPSKDACLKDGRWHKVFENSAGGGVIFGSRIAVRDLVREGAQVGVSVGVPNPYFGASFDLCASIVVSNDTTSNLECLTHVRSGGGDWDTSTAGASRDNAGYFSDGTVVIRNEGPPATTGKFKVPLVWRARF